MATTSRCRLDPQLRSIQPKNTRVIVKPKSVIEHRHGKHTIGMQFTSGKKQTILIHPYLPKAEIAHEFGHAAFHHPTDTENEPMGKHIRIELQAWQWAEDHWAKPFHIKTIKMTDRRRWILKCMWDAIMVYNAPVSKVVTETKKQVRALEIKPFSTRDWWWMTQQLKAWKKQES